MFKYLVIIFTMLFFMTGCGTTPKPAVLSERSASPSPLINFKPQKVLLIFDLRLIETHIGSHEYMAMQNLYGSVAKIMVERIGAQGILSDYEIRDSSSPMLLPSSGYSHILVENLISATQKGYSSASHPSSVSFITNQKWEGVLFETSKPPAKLIYRQTYNSDAIGCFNTSLIVTDEVTCKKDYIEHLLGHLTLIGIKSNVATVK
jgi:hypothetical protein